MACFQRDQLYKNTRNFASPSYCSYSIKKINSQTYHDFTARNSRNTLQLKILPKKITKETFIGKRVQRQNARLSQLQIKMSSLKDCISSDVWRKNYTGLCRNIVVENIPHALNVFFSN